MSLTNPKDVVTEERLSEFYQGIFPYLGGMPEMVANKFSKGDIYSTDEKMIGCWTDGKPLYQKSFETADNLTGNNIVVNSDLSSLSIDNVIDVESFKVKTSDHAIHQIPNIYISENGLTESFGFSIVVNRSRINVRQDNTYKDEAGKFYVTIKYTKTTDSAVSIGDESDYSTTEKIVGTWIDGKPVYQKTIIDTLPETTTKNTVVNKDIEQPSNLNIISITGLLNNDVSTIMFPCYFGDGSGVNVNATYRNAAHLLRLSNANPDNNNKTVYVTIQYTKTTD